MKIRSLIAVGAVALTAGSAAPAAGAQEGGQPPSDAATFKSKIKVDGDAATLKVSYTCDAGSALWVSAKQAASLGKDKALLAEGSSKVSKAWWQSHRNRFACDGTKQTATFSIDKVEPGSKGRLKKGFAYVQFCVSEGEESLTLYKTGWVRVA